MDDWGAAIFQVKNAADRTILGTAFGIFGRRVLTCRHVLLGLERQPVSQREQISTFRYPSVFLFNSVKTGPLAVAEWAFHDQYDVACGYLADGTQSAELAVRISIVQPSTKVICAGFPHTEPDTLHTFERQVAAAQGPAGLILDGALAPGMSGGPALADGRAIGVVFADAVNDSMTYLAPLNAINSWVEKVFPPIGDRPTGPAGGLANVPIAGGLKFHDVPPAVIEEFARVFEDRVVARTFFSAAMALRAAHNPEGFTERQIVVRLQEIDWSTPAEARWSTIIEKCAQRSQRTLAALFFAPDSPQPEFMASPERELFERFREKLMR